MKKNANRFTSNRVVLEKLKHQTAILFVLARLLFFLELIIRYLGRL